MKTVNNTVCNLQMPQEIKTKWLSALRSGDYTQSGGSLKDEQGYCCLGVLMEVVDGENVFEKWADENGTLPLPEWYNANSMRSFHLSETLDMSGYSKYPIRNDSVLYQRNDGYCTYEFKPGNDYATPVSDESVPPASFLEIADFIEHNVKGV